MIFSAAKIKNSQQKNYIVGIFLVFCLKHRSQVQVTAVSAIVGTSKNLLAKAVLTSTHNLCFGTKTRKIIYPCKPQFYYIKAGFKRYSLQGYVCIMIQTQSTEETSTCYVFYHNALQVSNNAQVYEPRREKTGLGVSDQV